MNSCGDFWVFLQPFWIQGWNQPRCAVGLSTRTSRPQVQVFQRDISSCLRATWKAGSGQLKVRCSGNLFLHCRWLICCCGHTWLMATPRVAWAGARMFRAFLECDCDTHRLPLTSTGRGSLFHRSLRRSEAPQKDGKPRTLTWPSNFPWF